MQFIFIGALLGAIFGGINGLFIGGLIGYAAGFVLQRTLIGGLQIAQAQLIESIFAVMGALCKADKLVTRDEIRAVEQMFGMLKLQGEQRNQARAAFNRGKQPDFDLDAAVDSFARISRGRGVLVQLFLQLQCMAVAADGRVDAAEHRMLVQIARRLGLAEADVAQLEALLRSATQGGSGPGRPGRAPSRDQLADAYAALGVTPQSSDVEIKRAYRKLISQNHPDKLAARGLPESMRAVAEERSREINSAYDLITAARTAQHSR
ncbi:MAG: co-chaperone DjlA [Gammaproteobacteria bacterium]|nr:co-chaperone DjlA [Gammaproteobacteria bacterium]MDH5303758.1 co-chaperone DjlA [Gammaproteobacteria bacterium]MDH5322651.1 co-chaperone DjlA [Gammaproteobacteria bacterium]